MSLFDDLFVPLEFRNQKNIDALREDLLLSDLDTASAARVARALAQRVDQLELVNRALIGILKKRGLLSDAELDLMAQQIDLADGVEDGRISSAVLENAPTCGQCGRFVNPQRKTCVYCEAPVAQTASKKPPVRVVKCASCGTSVPERSTYFSNVGVVCSPCFGTLDE